MPTAAQDRGAEREADPDAAQSLDGEALDLLIGGWLRALACAGKPARPADGPPERIAIDGKWLRGAGDGQVKLFAALLLQEGAVIAQHRIPDETTETTQVKALLGPVGLAGAVVTADAVHVSRETAEYIAGERKAGYLLSPLSAHKTAGILQGLGRHGVTGKPVGTLGLVAHSVSTQYV